MLTFSKKWWVGVVIVGVVGSLGAGIYFCSSGIQCGLSLKTTSISQPIANSHSCCAVQNGKNSTPSRKSETCPHHPESKNKECSLCNPSGPETQEPFKIKQQSKPFKTPLSFLPNEALEKAVRFPLFSVCVSVSPPFVSTIRLLC